MNKKRKSIGPVPLFLMAFALSPFLIDDSDTEFDY